MAKTRMTSDEAIAKMEAQENTKNEEPLEAVPELPDDFLDSLGLGDDPVTPNEKIVQANEPDDFPDMEALNQKIQEALSAEPIEGNFAPDAEEVMPCPVETKEAQVECPYCHNPMFVTMDAGADEKEAQAVAEKFCKCAGAMLAKQGSNMGRKIDMLFGENSEKYGFMSAHSPEELEIIKTVGLYVAQRKVKSVTVTLENGDKAVIVVIKDKTKVWRSKNTKAELEA